MEHVNISPEFFQRNLSTREEREDRVALIIEQQTFTRTMLQRFLGLEFRIFTADAGKAGLVHYVNHVPDITFINFNLPDMSGLEICKLLSKLDRKSHIVMLDGENDTERTQQALSSGAKSCIVKPYTRGKIQDAMALYFSQIQTLEKS